MPLALLGLYDITQKKHNILHNYPIAGHMRFLLESMGPELHQYLVENDEDGRPFNRDQRSLIYERAKNVEDKKPFGTELDVYAPGLHVADALDRHAPDDRGPGGEPAHDGRRARSASSPTRRRSSTSRR